MKIYYIHKLTNWQRNKHNEQVRKRKQKKSVIMVSMTHQETDVHPAKKTSGHSRQLTAYFDHFQRNRNRIALLTPYLQFAFL
jgi:hypothetical protein